MKRKNKFILFLIIFAGIALFAFFKFSGSSKSDAEMKEIRPVRGEVRLTVSTTGTVSPRNRLEVTPSVSGRVEKILVNEGDVVRKGQIIAYMSSTDRASLIDAARAQGSAAVKYWEDAYKLIPIVAPIGGTVIVRTIEPGQTVTASSDIAVISDVLIVKAAVDETDIGRVALGQRAEVSLDAHPDIKVNGTVSRIYYESATSNNVTIYYVQIECDEIPQVFRSGMSSNIEIVEKTRKDVLLLPSDAVQKINGKSFVLLKNPKGGNAEPEIREVETGLASNGSIEIVSGIRDEDVVLVASKDFVLPKTDGGKNMFLPQPGSRAKMRPGSGGPM